MLQESGQNARLVIKVSNYPSAICSAIKGALTREVNVKLVYNKISIIHEVASIIWNYLILPPLHQP